MSNLENALSLASKGFAVFPYWPIENGRCSCSNEDCASAGKHPRVTGYLYQATTSQRKIEKWWQDWPDSGIGIHPKNMLIIDVDGSVGHESLQQFQKQFGQLLPKTYRVNSGNTAPHHYQLYYRCPPGLRVKNGPLTQRLINNNCLNPEHQGFPAIDIKSGGGQIAAAGNLHKCGRVYSWDHKQGFGEPSTTDDIPKAPSWLTDALGLVEEYQTSPKQLKVRKGKGKPSLGDHLTVGSDEELLFALGHRFPIPDLDTRRGIIADAICWMMSVRGLKGSRITYLLSEHLRSYENKFNADLQPAINDMERSVKTLEQKIKKGTFRISIDHNLVASNQRLVPALETFIDRLQYCRGKNKKEGQETPYAYGVSLAFPLKEMNVIKQPEGNHWIYGKGNPLNEVSNYPCPRLSKKEQEFIHCLLLRYQYEVFYHQTIEEFKLVESQIMAMMRIKFDATIGRRKYYEIKNKFFGGKKLQGGNRQPEIELFRCIRPSKSRGEASVYIPIEAPLLDLQKLQLRGIKTHEQFRHEWQQPSNY